MVMVGTAAVAGLLVHGDLAEARPAGGGGRAAPRDRDRAAGPRVRRDRPDDRLPRRPRARDALLLRRLRDRLPADQGQAAEAGDDGVGPVAAARLRARRPAGRRRGGPLLSLHRIRDGHHRDRHPDPDPQGRRRAEDPVRHVPAGGRGDGRVRPDPSDHADPLGREPAARGAGPDPVRRRRGVHRPAGGEVGVEGLAADREDARDLEPARGPPRGRPGLRPRGAGGRPRPRPAARRLRRRDDHPPRRARPRGLGARLQADGGRLRAADPVLLHHQRDGLRPRCADRLGRRRAEDAHVRRPVPDRARRPGAASSTARRSRRSATA